MSYCSVLQSSQNKFKASFGTTTTTTGLTYPQQQENETHEIQALNTFID